MRGIDVLTVDSSETILQRVKRDRVFATALFVAALSAIDAGEPEVARILLRDVTNGLLAGPDKLEIVSNANIGLC